MSTGLEQQLQVLASCGIAPRPGVTSEHLCGGWAESEYTAEPFSLLLTALGGELESSPGGYCSDDIWHFDTECIEDHGDYVRIAERMRTLAAGDLPLEEIADHVDVEEGVAWLEFALNGNKVHWDARVDDDWVDPMMLQRFARLLDGQRTDRRFTYLDLGGQDCLIGCSTAAQLMALRKQTGLKFEWLR